LKDVSNYVISNLGENMIKYIIFTLGLEHGNCLNFYQIII